MARTPPVASIHKGTCTCVHTYKHTHALRTGGDQGCPSQAAWLSVSLPVTQCLCARRLVPSVLGKFTL